MLSPHSPPDRTTSLDDDRADDIVYPATVPFLVVHLACLAALWAGVTAEALVLCGALYVLRMFAIGAGYHRYFAHRAYKTSRAVQFLLAFLAQTSAQRGVLWWAAKHRRHHSHADTELDVHSPRQHGFLRAHVGWIFTPRHGATDYDAIADFARYPELVWLDRHPYLPSALLRVLTWLIAGWPGLVVGFCWSTVLVWHGTFAINSVAHVAGRRRYTTSKLLNAATAAALARERPDVHVTCFDPGLMLGTGLSRQYPAAVRRLTTLLAPALGTVLPFASTPRSSGRALARLLLEVPAPAASGAYVDHRLRTRPASERARNAGFQAEELRDSRALLALATD